MELFDDLKNWFGAKRSENRARAALAHRVSELLEMSADEPDEWQMLVERQLNGKKSGELIEANEGTVIVNTKAEGAGWEIMGSAWKGHIGQDQQIMVAQARRFFRFDPNAQAAILGIVEYLMGRGVNITPKSKDPRIWKLWRNFWTSPDNKMGIRQFEIIKRWVRDGEVFLRYYTKDGAGTKTPFTTIRFMDPIDVRRAAKEGAAQTDKTSQGITFDPDDAEKPLKYYMRERVNQYKEVEVDAAEVQHVKFITADMDQSRGESAIQTIMDLFTHYKQWLKNRIILNKLRTAIFAVREIDDKSGATVASLAQSIPASGRTAQNETKKQNIRPGTLYTPPPGVKMRMESANINASDVKEDGRNMILGMAAGMGEPEYMFGDASNANYSSTMMAESPFVKRVHLYQSFLEEMLWKPMFRRVVQGAVDAGKLVAPAEEDIFADPANTDLTEAQIAAKKAAGEDVPDEGESAAPISESEAEIFFGCDIEWPEIIHRDPKEQTDALVLARNEGWISDKTASEKLGFDYGEEVRKQQQIEAEAEANGNPLMQRVKDQMQNDAEAAAGAAQANKEEEIAGGGGAQ